MTGRFALQALLLTGLLIPLASCSSSSLDSIVITPSTVTVDLSTSGAQLTTQYKAIGYYGHADHQTTADITDQVTWSSYFPEMVTITSSGVAIPTGDATGYTQITASAPGYEGLVTSNASTFTVQAAGTALAEPATSR